MKSSQLTFAALALAIVAAAAWTLSSPAPTAAQAQGPGGQGIKIAIASPAKIFGGIKEKTDVQARLSQQREDLGKEEASRRQKLKDMQSELELIKQEAPQYEEKVNAINEAAAAFKVWGESSQAKSARFEKQQTKMLFDKITAGIAEIAKEKGIDLVIAEQPTVNIDRITQEGLQQLMVQRQVLYGNAGLDITNDVISRLDQHYNAQKK